MVTWHEGGGEQGRLQRRLAAAITALQSRRPVRRPRTIRDWVPPTLPEEPGGDRVDADRPGDAPDTA
jgi:hypothetical protein